MAKKNTKTTKTTDAGEMLDTLKITKREGRKVGGNWITGTIAGHKFEALVFPEHAECESYELGNSRISKLWIKNIEENREAANFDRGWDVEPTTPAARQIVDLLAAGLAELVFGH